jgi:hypothetical protein
LSTRRAEKITKGQIQRDKVKLNNAQTSKMAEPPTMVVRNYENVRSLHPLVIAQFDLVQQLN